MDSPTLDTLFRAHARDITAFLRHQLPRPDLAEDLCQEVFLRLGRQRTDQTHSGRDASGTLLEQPRAYLFRIARNLLIDHHRRGQSRPGDRPLEDDDVPCLACPYAASYSDPEAATERRLCRRGLEQAMAGLPPRLRQALVWHRLEGLSQAEIGRRLGVSERMAGRYVAQAIGRCREQLIGTAS
ncbi:RNA polymerase sigma factor [Halomonas getboli]|uniref:RNA polymerase sigma factor n=1 Tax=Halomonas getboli TaxID=2935862 RepID=UPI001FFE5060|nr:RNA polymerase sigma factor [Halomonas getboli]MCK2184299.1 RNA polymerase sigma factor [Halomonas getboli]